MGSKSAENLIDSIEKSKSKCLSNLIFALGIRHIGLNSAKIIAKKYGDMDSVMSADVDSLADVKDVGLTMARSIREFFDEVSAKELVEKLKDAGVNMKYIDTSLGFDNRFEGLTFVITGTLSNMGRKEAEKIICDFGGKVSGSVSKKTDYIVAGESAGSKLAKANELGIKVLSEEEFLNMTD